MPEENCTSCKKKISNLRVARFKCPACGKSEIIRCAACRSNAVAYECKDCGFRGPN